VESSFEFKLKLKLFIDESNTIQKYNNTSKHINELALLTSSLYVGYYSPSGKLKAYRL